MSLHVLTITPNPSVDLLHEATQLVWDDANRVAPPRRRAGGQGINLARAMRALGGNAHALAPLGGPAGSEIAAHLRSEGLAFTAVQASGDTRTFVAVRESATGRSLLINPRGPDSTAEDVARLRTAAEMLIERERPAWVACCGSLPPGFPPDFYAQLSIVARRAGSKFVADCDGMALELAASAGCDLLVPNAFEAQRLTGMPVSNWTEAIPAAGSLVTRGTRTVAVTLGPAGAVAAAAGVPSSEPRVRIARAHTRKYAEGREGSAVGAGDSFLACLILRLEEGMALDGALRCATAAGAAVLAGTGSSLLDRAGYESALARTDVEVVS